MMRHFQLASFSTLALVTLLFFLTPSNLVKAFLVKTIRVVSSQQRHRTSESALHGIKGFRKWFEQQFPSAITYFPDFGDEDPLVENADDEQQTASNTFSSKSHDSFDHVLIDMNQLLHTTMRRARSEGHALTMVMKEIDYCVKMTNPTKSLVFCMDGSPGAGKLAAQRRRRLGCVLRAQWKREAKTRQKQWRSSNNSNANKDREQSSSKFRRILDHDEMATLCITPGTSFMERARDALYYYVWQRFSNQYSNLPRTVKVYISSSDTPGEGEIKILDWINLHASTSVNPDTTGHIRPGDSIAIFGGDSDLVLEGLVLPAQITHNVFIIIPEKTRKRFCVSLWEVTRVLMQFLPQLQDNVDDIMKLRMDLVLLLILNGNDYLPKLRGSAGFHKLFHTYLRLLKQYLGPATTEDSSIEAMGLNGSRTPTNQSRLPFFFLEGKKTWSKGTDITELNTQFALDFFSELALIEPKELPDSDSLLPYALSVTPLSNLYQLLDGGWLPKPATFEVFPATNEGHETVRLTLGDPSLTNSILGNGKNKETHLSGNNTVNPSNCFIFEVDHREHASLKSAKHRLSAIALEVLLGITESDNDNDEDDFVQNEGDWESDMDEAVVPEGRRNGLLQADAVTLTRVAGYDWEVPGPVQADVKQYVAGLLWNVQTYKDGVCADYAYNYGRRMSPTSLELCQYLQQCTDNNVTLGLDKILPGTFISPLNAGLSCLAALPSLAKHIVPEPYRILTLDNAVEDIYGQCMDATTNVFDIEKFRLLCSNELQKKIDINPIATAAADLHAREKRPRSGGRRIRTTSRHWTVLSWSKDQLGSGLTPPDPFSDRINPLKHCPRIRASLVEATVEPKWMANTPSSRKKRRRNFRWRSQRQRGNSEWTFGGQSLLDVPYKRPFVSDNHPIVERFDVTVSSERDEVYLSVETGQQDSFYQTKKNVQNQTSASIIKMLVDSGFFASEIDWSYMSCTQQATEIMVLSLEMGSPPEKYSWESKRKLGTKRQLVKHYLASKVLAEIFGQEWMNLRIEQMREMKDTASLRIE